MFLNLSFCLKDFNCFSKSKLIIFLSLKTEFINSVFLSLSLVHSNINSLINSCFKSASLFLDLFLVSISSVQFSIELFTISYF